MFMRYSLIPTYKLFQKIYNRWGEEVASIDGLNFWDGRWKGEDHPAGTYLHIYCFRKHLHDFVKRSTVA